MTVKIKRVYDDPSTDDGYRILVDRLWPRGISKGRAKLDDWLKDIAPSPGLRVWFGHQPERFAEFKARYERELSSNPAVGHLKEILAAHDPATLVFAAHDPAINHAQVLLGYLMRR